MPIPSSFIDSKVVLASTLMTTWTWPMAGVYLMALSIRLVTIWPRAFSSPSNMIGCPLVSRSNITWWLCATACKLAHTLWTICWRSTWVLKASSLLSNRDKANKSDTKSDKRIDWPWILRIKRCWIWRSIASSSINVSAKPRMAVIGVFNSCEALATKSARILSMRWKSVVSCSTSIAPAWSECFNKVTCRR